MDHFCDYIFFFSSSLFTVYVPVSFTCNHPASYFVCTPDVVTGEMGPDGVAGSVGACLISLVMTRLTPVSPLSWPPGAGVSWPGPCVLTMLLTISGLIIVSRKGGCHQARVRGRPGMATCPHVPTCVGRGEAGTGSEELMGRPGQD